MTSAEAYLRTLERDQELAWQLKNMLRRARRLNVDFREPVRRRLRMEAAMLAHRLDTSRALLHTMEPSVAAASIVDRIDWYLTHARGEIAAFRRALDAASTLDTEQVIAGPAEAVHCLRRAIGDTIRLVNLAAAAVRPAPMRASLRVASLAARLLPWEHRDRYLGEYLSELDELAQDDAVSRRTQLRHALRLLARAPALHLALRSPVEEKYRPASGHGE